MMYQKPIKVDTAGHGSIHDISNEVAKIVRESGVKKGLANIFNTGSTAVVGTIEFEPGLEKDISSIMDRLIPPSRDYGHEQRWHDGNGHSHLQATLMGQSLTVPVASGELVLGTWQQIFHLECDIKPRTREIIITVQGDTDDES